MRMHDQAVRPSAALICVLIAFSLAGLAVAAVPAQQEGRIVRRLSLKTDGPLVKVSTADLLKLVEIEEGQPYTASGAKNSIQRLFSTGLFHDVQIAVDPASPQLVDVTLILIRRYVVSEVRFSGRIGLSAQLLRQSLALRAGDSFSPQLIEETRERLKALYLRHGYYQAVIEPRYVVSEESALVKVVWEITASEQATVGQITLDVAGAVDLEAVRALLETKAGGPYSEVRKDQDIAALERHFALLGYLNPDIYLRGGARYDPEANQVQLTFRIVPRQRTEIRFLGIEPSAGEMQQMPLFAGRSAADVFLEETVEWLTERYQEKGYFLAGFEFEKSNSPGGEISVTVRAHLGDRLSVAGIEFQGNQFATSKILEGIVSVRRAGAFGRGRFTDKLAEEDLKRIRSFYRRNGYLDAEVSYLKDLAVAGRLKVIYTVVEGPRYQVESLDFVGNRELSGEQLQALVQTRPGEPFSPLALAEDRAAVVAAYEDLGFREADFRSEVSNLSNHRMAVVYFVQEGERSFVDEVVLTGYRATKETVIRREVELRSGAPLALNRALATEANLYDLAVFNRVQLSRTPSYRDAQAKTVIVNVEEAKKFTLLYGIGYSSFEGPRGTFGVTNHNFLGMARSLSLSLRAGTLRQRGALAYTIRKPYQLRLPTVLAISGDNEKAQTQTTVEGTSAFRGRPYDSLRVSASSRSEKRLSRRESLFFRYQFEQVELNVPQGLESELEFFREEERLRLSSVSFSYLNESRNNPSDPSGGFFLSADTLLAPRMLGSEAELARLFVQSQYYRQLHPRLVWVSALRLGLVTPFGKTDSVPITERFFSGGATTLRGLPQDLAGPLLRDEETGEVVLVNDRGQRDENGRPVPLGGEALIIFNTEFRFPLVGFLKGNVFYDLGNVFEKVSKIGDGQFTNTVGLGLHVATPVGPVRFDIGYNPSPPDLRGFHHWNFHFTLGHPF